MAIQGLSSQLGIAKVGFSDIEVGLVGPFAFQILVIQTHYSVSYLGS